MRSASPDADADTNAGDDHHRDLWPSPDYHRQIERLRAAVGETIYLVELIASPVQLSVHLSGQPYELLGVIDFPRPDPARGLAPHLLLLDDGRGLNLGRIEASAAGPSRPHRPSCSIWIARPSKTCCLPSGDCRPRFSRNAVARPWGNVWGMG